MVGAVLVVLSSGCESFWSNIAGDCEEMLTCEHFRPTSTGSGPHVECVPSESKEAIGDTCGVFVAASGNDAGAGTKAEPVKTLSEAIERAAGKGTAVYACAEEFAEAVEVPAGVTLFGGLDCANGWRWIGEEKKTTVAPGVEEIPLRLVRGEGAVRIEDVSARAADAQTAGSSSIAVVVDGATVELARCELIAGNGADGADGEDAPSEAAMPGPEGMPGTDACSDLDTSGAPDESLPGGVQVENACGGDALSIGGEGGDGKVSNGGDGATSQGTAETARGGLGEPVTGTWDCAGSEPNGGGDDGVSGVVGEPGIGASGNGTLSPSGYAGVSGGAGGMGKPGQGGGGGGGAKGGAICTGGATGAGASGGSGGAGGCGGLPGQGGGAGGASIALVSVEGKVTLTDCSLKAGSGGKGGAGGDLQPGGSGGVGGLGGTGVGGSNPACDGGRGGKGGNGGPGGGGLGGPSLAMAFRGEPVKQAGKTMLTPGTPGAGGPGGSNNVASNAGADGVMASDQELP
ncbi:PGRS family protein [Sorangium sp. So ce291]|uniref:PGRS family protein n=1 Tax=Sorangium sp. So ce291 TaxID=3133294 RepID=UPI003F644D86